MERGTPSRYLLTPRPALPCANSCASSLWEHGSLRPARNAAEYAIGKQSLSSCGLSEPMALTKVVSHTCNTNRVILRARLLRHNLTRSILVRRVVLLVLVVLALVGWIPGAPGGPSGAGASGGLSGAGGLGSGATDGLSGAWGLGDLCLPFSGSRVSAGPAGLGSVLGGEFGEPIGSLAGSGVIAELLTVSSG